MWICFLKTASGFGLSQVKQLVQGGGFNENKAALQGCRVFLGLKEEEFFNLKESTVMLSKALVLSARRDLAGLERHASERTRPNAKSTRPHSGAPGSAEDKLDRSFCGFSLSLSLL